MSQTNNRIKLNSFLWSISEGRRLLLLSLFLMVLLSNFIEIFLCQYFNRIFIDTVVARDASVFLIFTAAFLYSSCQNIEYLLQCVEDKIKFNSSLKIRNSARNNIYSHVLKQPMSYFTKNFSGALSTKINSLADNYIKTTEMSMEVLARTLLSLVVPLFYIDMSIWLSISFLLLLPLYFMSLIKIRKNKKASASAIHQAKSECFGLITDSFINIENIKCFAREKRELNNIKKAGNKILRRGYDFLVQAALYDTISGLWCLGFSFTIFAIAAVLLAKNKIAMGDFVLVVVITSIFKYVVDDVSSKSMKIAEANAKIEGDVNTLLQPISIADRSGAKPLQPKEGKIVFNHISFYYEH